MGFILTARIAYKGRDAVAEGHDHIASDLALLAQMFKGCALWGFTHSRHRLNGSSETWTVGQHHQETFATNDQMGRDVGSTFIQAEPVP